ncbi:MAG: DUF2510 domain-containing protein [Candidatus Nanopelagicales bacterium]
MASSKPRLTALSVALVVAGAVFLLVGAVGFTVTGPTRTLDPVSEFTAPTETRVMLTEGTWSVWQQIVAGGVAKGPLVDVGRVSVDGPNGPVKLQCAYCDDVPPSQFSGDHRFVGIVSFYARSSGEYTIKVASAGPIEMVVAPGDGPIEDPAALVWWFIGFVGIATIAVVVVRYLRQLRNRPIAVPAGWYPDPNMPGQMRWFNGREWTTDTAPYGPV